MAKNVTFSKQVDGEKTEISMDWGDKLGIVSVRGKTRSGKTYLAKKALKSFIENGGTDYYLGVGHPDEWNGKDISVDESKFLKRIKDDSEENSEKQSLRDIKDLVEDRLRKKKSDENISFEPVLLIVEEDFFEKGVREKDDFGNTFDLDEANTFASLIRSARAVDVYIIFVNSGSDEVRYFNGFIRNFIYTSEYEPHNIPDLKLDEFFVVFWLMQKNGDVFTLED